MMLEIVLQVVLGITGFALIFFVPGYFVMNLFYEKVKGLERIGFVVGISIMIAIILGLILGLLGVFSVWSSLAAYAIIIIVFLLVKRSRRR